MLSTCTLNKGAVGVHQCDNCYKSAMQMYGVPKDGYDQNGYDPCNTRHRQSVNKHMVYI